MVGMQPAEQWSQFLMMVNQFQAFYFASGLSYQWSEYNIMRCQTSISNFTLLTVGGNKASEIGNESLFLHDEVFKRYIVYIIIFSQKIKKKFNKAQNF